MYSLTIFKSIFDNKTHRRIDIESWDKFKELLYGLSKKEITNKKDAYLISPATYLPNTTRANKNVVCWAKWVALDVDSWEIKGDINDILLDRFSNWNFICYSTASSKRNQPKFRLVFSLDRNVEASEIKHFWYAINTELDSIGDRQTKDLSRMYYIPASYANAYNFIFDNTGSDVVVNDLLNKYEYSEKRSGNTLFDSLSEDIQQSLIQYRKEQMTNTNIKWSSYHDCPFVNKRLINEYVSISETGWYHKMYQIMVSIAGNAVKQKYPITINEIVQLCKDLDRETGNWYENRPLNKEAQRAIEFVYSNL